MDGVDHPETRWQRYLNMDWTKYVNKQLRPEKPVLFWNEEVSEKQQNQLIGFLHGMS